MSNPAKWTVPVLRSGRLHRCILLTVLATVPLWVSAFYLEFATLILVYALFAMSLGLLVGYAGMVSLGHAAFFGVGAYTTALLIEGGSAHLALVLPASAAMAGLAALGIGALAVRTTGVSFIMITLALAQLVYSIAINAPWAGSTDGMLLAQRPATGVPGVDLEHPATFYGYCLLLATLGYLVLRRLTASAYGQALQGIRLNPERMEAMGYRIAAFRLTAFVQAGVFAGVAGHAYAAAQFFVDPSALHWTASGQALMMVVLGGEGTLLGPALGALVFHGLEQWISMHTKHWMLPMGMILVLLVLFGRGGLVRIGARLGTNLGSRLGLPGTGAATGEARHDR